MDGKITRCGWAGEDQLYCRYHDEEWGVPIHDDRRLFEMLTLEGAQAGLSWITILRKRENYRRAFDGFDIDKILEYGEDKLGALLSDAGIVRNRLKIQSVMTNARAFRAIQREYGSFDSFLWGYVDGEPIINSWADLAQIPAKTELSDRISADLKRRGFKFVGSTIIYAYMQSVGMVNDHITGCSFRGHSE